MKHKAHNTSGDKIKLKTEREDIDEVVLNNIRDRLSNQKLDIEVQKRAILEQNTNMEYLFEQYKQGKLRGEQCRDITLANIKYLANNHALLQKSGRMVRNEVINDEFDKFVEFVGNNSYYLRSEEIMIKNKSLSDEPIESVNDAPNAWSSLQKVANNVNRVLLNVQDFIFEVRDFIFGVGGIPGDTAPLDDTNNKHVNPSVSPEIKNEIHEFLNKKLEASNPPFTTQQDNITFETIKSQASKLAETVQEKVATPIKKFFEGAFQRIKSAIQKIGKDPKQDWQQPNPTDEDDPKPKNPFKR